MASPNNPTHDETWDDTLLVNSWNEAVEEYKKYHSIQARGDDIDSVLGAHEKQGQGIIGPQMDYGGQANERHGSDAPVTSESHETKVSGIGSQVQNNQAPASQNFNNGAAKGPALPQHLAGQVRDEGLKNLLMSWYYAGYYTGLYEGQQQGLGDKNAKHEG